MTYSPEAVLQGNGDDGEGSTGLVTGVPTEDLRFTIGHGDRFVESRSLVPLRIVAHDQDGREVIPVPPHRAVQILGALTTAIGHPDFDSEAFGALVDRLGLAPLASLVLYETEPLPVSFDHTRFPLYLRPRLTRPRYTSEDERRYDEPGLEAEPTESEELHRQLTRFAEIRAERGVAEDAGRLGPAVAALTATIVDKTGLNLERLLDPDIGVLFLDRTRIRPVGFVGGEHITTVSLAPGEEVTVEQTSFSKREATYEDVNETEKQFDLELSSTLSTSIEEGVNQAHQHTDTAGWMVGGSIGAEFKGIKVGVQGGASDTVTDADQRSRNRTTTDSFMAAQKVTAKYRAQHKTTFRIVTEQRLEITNRRVLRNPNRYTPIDLHYFKILQRLRLSHERYGVRLCWAPFVPDPALDVVDRIFLGRLDIANRNAPKLPPRPPEPMLPATRPPMTIDSPVMQVGNTWWGISVEVPVSVEVPAGYTWDGDAEFVKASLMAQFIQCTGWTRVFGNPTLVEGKPTATVHVGTDFRGSGRVDVQIRARFVPLPGVAETEYAAKYAAWQAALQAWENTRVGLQATADAKTATESDAFEKSLWESLDPISELLHRIVSVLWPLATRDQGSEVELWRELFEWETAGYDLYPGWWLDKPLRDPTRSPTDFRNASWARVYLSLRPGREAEALAFILTGGDPSKLTPEVTHAIAGAVEQLEDYQTEQFGSTTGGPTSKGGDGDCPELSETVICLGQWEEAVPTDGTHLEVTVAPTTGADTLTLDELSDARTARAAQTAQTDAVSEVVGRVSDANVHVRVEVPRDRTTPPLP